MCRRLTHVRALLDAFAQRHPVDPVIPGDPFDEPHQVAPGYHRGAL